MCWLLVERAKLGTDLFQLETQRRWIHPLLQEAAAELVYVPTKLVADPVETETNKTRGNSPYKAWLVISCFDHFGNMVK